MVVLNLVSLHNVYTLCCVGSSGSTVVCISPLISIMMDQTAKFTALGLKAEYVGMSQEDPDVIHKVLSGDIQLLFTSLESILTIAISGACSCYSIVRRLPREIDCHNS